MADTFCVLPWMHLATHPHGGVTLCCVSDFTAHANEASSIMPNGATRLGNLKTDTLDSVINSGNFSSVRREMLMGKAPKPCLRCYREEASGIVSKRMDENNNYSDFTLEKAKQITRDDGTIAPALRFVELRLGNICNVKCRSCNPVSSSKWTTEYAKMEQDLPFVRAYSDMKSFDWPENPAFWDELLAHHETLELFYINGGEPTLIDEHWRFLERLIEIGAASRIALWYNINMTNLPEKTFDLWRQFKSVRVSCSIDDLGARNRLLRHGTDWNKVVKNLDLLQSQEWILTSVTQTISWTNLLYVDEFYREMHGLRDMHVFMNYVYDPAFLSPWIVPIEIKELAIERAARTMPEGAHAQFQNQLLTNASDPAAFERGLNYSKYLDKSRREDSRAIFPELYAMIDKYHRK